MQRNRLILQNFYLGLGWLGHGTCWVETHSETLLSHTENTLTPKGARGPQPACTSPPLPFPEVPQLDVPTAQGGPPTTPSGLTKFAGACLVEQQAHGDVQPAVLPTAVWQDFLPLREFQVISASDFLTTATARYP